MTELLPNRIRAGFAALVTGAAFLALSVAVPGASAATAHARHVSVPAQYNITSSTVNVTTSKGKTLQLSLSAFYNFDGQNVTNDQLYVNLTKSGKTSAEYENWSFNLKPQQKPFVYSNGSGHLRTGRSIAPYGSVNLTISRISKSACSSNPMAETDRINLTGTVRFKTNTNWGVVSLANVTFPNTSSNHSVATNGQFCFPKFPTPPCTTGYSFGSGAIFFGGVSRVVHATAPRSDSAYLTGTHYRTLSKPSGATWSTSVFDYVTTILSSKTLTISAAAGSQYLKGTATITLKGNPKTYPGSDCKVGSSKHKQYEKSYTALSWKNGSTPLAAHPGIGKPFSEANGSTATITISTYK